MKKIFKKLAVLAAAIVAAFGAFSAPVTAFAEETATETTSVMEDLQSDATFSKDAYPGKTVDELKGAGEELLQVIRIGESVDAELYVYVYQPSDETKEIEAAKILIGQTASESSARVYPLTLVSSEGVFDKYRVDGLEVLSSFDVRHYTITSLYRPFDKALDEETGNDNVESQIAVRVAQTWYARGADEGKIEYAHTEDEVITITDEWHGSIFYSDGWKWIFPNTTSHFIAFTSDHLIEKLKSAEIYFQYQFVEQKLCLRCLKGEQKRGSLKNEHIVITEEDIGSNEADGWFSHKYEWNRIEPITDFIANEEDLSDAAKAEMQEIYDNSAGNGAWVLRFFETEGSLSNFDWWHWCGLHYAPEGSTIEKYEVSDVAILKLTFETAGVPYTMGVVDSMTTSDNVPDGNHGFWEGVKLDLKNSFNDIQKTLRLASLAIGACFALGLVALATYGIVTLINWIRDGRRRGGSSGG